MAYNLGAQRVHISSGEGLVADGIKVKREKSHDHTGIPGVAQELTL